MFPEGASAPGESDLLNGENGQEWEEFDTPDRREVEEEEAQIFCGLGWATLSKTNHSTGPTGQFSLFSGDGHDGNGGGAGEEA